MLGTPPDPRHVTSSSERARRNAQMAARKAGGATWERIAAEFGVAKSTARKGVADHARALVTCDDGAVDDFVSALGTVDRPVDLDPQAIFLYVIRAHVEAMRDLAVLARTADHDGARVGAIKARAAAGVQLLDLFRMVGLLPNADRVLLARAEARRVRADIRDRGEMVAGAAA